MSHEKNLLDQLRINELNAISQHLNLGKEHLSRLLTPHEMQQLLRNISFKKNEKKKIKCDEQETIGKTAIIVSTVITSCIGGWLGLSAYTYLKLNSSITIFIVTASFVLGGAIAILNFYLTRRTTQESLVNKKLADLELTAINSIIKKNQRTLQKIENQIEKECRSLFLSKKKITLGEFIEKCLSDNFYFQFIYDEMKNIKNDSLKISYQTKFHRVANLIKKSAIQLRTQRENTFEKKETLPFSYIQKLILPPIKNKKKMPSFIGWVKKNTLSIAMSLTPTVLGGFASMFVLIDGIPTILYHYEVHFNLHDSQILFLKIAGLLFATSLTFYYGYSQMYSDYKSFCRTKQIEITRKNIVEQQSYFIQQSTLSRLLLKLHSYVKQLNWIYENLRMTK